MKMPERGRAGFLSAWTVSVGVGATVDEKSSAGERGGRDRNSSWSRIEDGGVGGQAENQVCRDGTCGQEELSCCSTEESETDEEDEWTEEGTLSASETCEVADRRLGMTLGAAGRGSTKPRPASAVSVSVSLSASLSMRYAALSKLEASSYDDRVKSLMGLARLML